eukprot:1276524-Rhodomonas_salina.1
MGLGPDLAHFARNFFQDQDPKSEPRALTFGILKRNLALSGPIGKKMLVGIPTRVHVYPCLLYTSPSPRDRG